MAKNAACWKTEPTEPDCANFAAMIGFAHSAMFSVALLHDLVSFGFNLMVLRYRSLWLPAHWVTQSTRQFQPDILTHPRLILPLPREIQNAMSLQLIDCQLQAVQFQSQGPSGQIARAFPAVKPDA